MGRAEVNGAPETVTGRTIAELFLRRTQATPDDDACIQFDAAAGKWRHYTWGEMRRMAGLRQAWLKTLSPAAGERVALMMPNGVEWVLFDVAAAGLGLVTVPLHAHDQPGNLRYILEQADARLLLIHSGEQWKTVRRALDGMDRPPVTVSVTDVGDDGVETLGDLLRGVARSDFEAGGGGGSGGDGGGVSGSNGDVASDDGGSGDALATIVYTSGTTGRPKGVMLSHRNLLSNAEAASRAVRIGRRDRMLSFLPLSHMFERTVGYYVPMMCGATVAYARSVAALSEDMTTLSPTCLISVPRIYERIHARLMERVKRGGRWRRHLFQLALAAGWRRFLWRQRGGGWHPLVLLWPLLRGVARRFHDRLGGRLRCMISGGAPLSPGMSRVFLSLGAQLLQGYGATEASPVVSVNRARRNRPDSVGVPLDGIEVKIGARDELLVRGPCVMLGYWRDPQATAKTVDAGGWLHTGDTARIEDGHLYITGRIKDIIVLSTGEKVAPADMEAAILLDPLFEQALVVGEGRPCLAVIAVVNAKAWQDEAAKAGAASGGLASDDAREFALTRIRRRLADFPACAEVRKAALVEQGWSMENGLLTPTLKPKRDAILAHHRDLIEEIYGQPQPTDSV